ncbi:MAG: hypothetical protein ABFE01_15790 [Phycisphaerales bacterium]
MSRHDLGILALCVILLVVSLGAVGSRGRTRAKEAVCVSHLRQWASAFDSALLDNDGYFPSRDVNDSAWWIGWLWAYHQDAGLMTCPAATDAASDVLPTQRAWRAGEHVGSYGVNGWMGRPIQDKAGRGYAPRAYHWRTLRVWEGDAVPVLGDMSWVAALPYESDAPQMAEQSPVAPGGDSEMELVCVNRHDGAVNFFFADGFVRKVGLKELWILKWHTSYNQNGPWTIAGGARPASWPEWMRQFKNF